MTADHSVLFQFKLPTPVTACAKRLKECQRLDSFKVLRDVGFGLATVPALP